MKGEKKDIRTKILESRGKLLKDERDKKSRWDRKIIETLRFQREYEEGKVIFIYASFGSEIDTQGLIKDLVEKEDKIVYIPKIVEGRMYPVRITKDAKYSRGAFGIMEPVETITCRVDEIDLVVVPGLAFTRKGDRIGYGKGYYDRFLKEYKNHQITLSYSFQVIESIPSEPWDERVKKIITEEEIIKIS